MEQALYLLSAAALGALHALEPGHGKTLVAAYMIGNRGGMWDAVKLGTVVTVTHTSGVVLIGVGVLLAASCIQAGALESWLRLGSSLMILGIGLSLLLRAPDAHAHTHDHDHDHDHDHAHDEPHDQTHRPGGQKELFWLGVSGGIIPCHGALAVLLATLSEGGASRLGWGIAMVLSFSLGLALVITALAAAASKLQSLIPESAKTNRWAAMVPRVSATLILVMGAFMTIDNLRGLNAHIPPVISSDLPALARPIDRQERLASPWPVSTTDRNAVSP